MTSRTCSPLVGHDVGTAPTKRAPAHRYVQRIDLRSLAAFAALFYGASLAAVSGAFFIVWVFASITGLVGRFEDFMHSIGFRGFHVVSAQLILGAILLALALAAFLTVVSVLAGAVYNLLASAGHAVQFSLATGQPSSELGRALVGGPSVTQNTSVRDFVPSALAAVENEAAFRAS